MIFIFKQPKQEKKGEWERFLELFEENSGSEIPTKEELSNIKKSIESKKQLKANIERKKQQANNKEFFLKNTNKLNYEKIKQYRSFISANIILELQELDKEIIKKIYCDFLSKKKFIFNTYNNQSIERSIGLSDTFKDDFDIYQIKIKKNNSNLKSIGSREIGNSGNFYNKNSKYFTERTLY